MEINSDYNPPQCGTCPVNEQETIFEWSIDSISTLSPGEPIADSLNFSEEWTVSFDFKPNMQSELTNNHKNVIHFSTGDDHSRYPAVWINPNTNDEMHICSNDNYEYTTEHVQNYCKDIKLKNDWNRIEIGQTKSFAIDDCNQLFYYIKLNDNVEHIISNNFQPFNEKVTGLKVYASYWQIFPSANGVIKNLIVKTTCDWAQGKPIWESSSCN